MPTINPRNVIYKEVGYSYPTSANAKRFRMPNGCYTVSLLFRGVHDSGPYIGTPYMTAEAISAFTDQEAAEICAEKHPAKWAPWTKQGGSKKATECDISRGEITAVANALSTNERPALLHA